MDEMDILAPTRLCLCSALRRASRTLTQHYERAFAGSGVRGTQFTILSAVAQAGPITIGRLAPLLGLERTTLSRALKPLVDRGLVQVDGDDDARVRIVAITKPGRALLMELLPRWEAAQASAAAILKKINLPDFSV